MLYQKQRDYRKAVKELAKATELDPTNAQVCVAARWPPCC
jgi:Flp pilus assembly protein TadD